MDRKTIAKKRACRFAALLCEGDLASGSLEERYEAIKEPDWPSFGMVKKGMEALIEELLHRAKPR